MKAIVYTEFGTPDVLHLKEVEKPAPKANEILIRISATRVNYGDMLARRFGSVTTKEFNMPGILLLPARLDFGIRKPKKYILGNEFSGVIEATGKDVKRFKAGDAVFGYRGPLFGAYAEYLCMPENGLVTHKPTNMSFEEATLIPYGALTALSHLKKINIQPGQNVLVNGASGGIGSAGVQLAKYFGAEVTGVCGTPRLGFVKSLGADKVIDYTKEDFTQNGEKYDLIYDILGRSSFDTCQSSLTPTGILLYASFKVKQLMQMMQTSKSTKKVLCVLSSENLDDLNLIKELVEAGKFRTMIDKRFPLEETAEAHRYYESGKNTGNVVISVG
ncbi:MAG: NAD(P)-dependent alcohol dehydrogenase [Anaerolineales bacterium]|nr:NAD(P)-dependent alcohol dehydrogenase [Anaerolineales bacterium]